MEDTFLQGGFLVVQSKGTVTLSPTWDALQRLEYNSYLLFWGLALSKISTFYSVIYESFHALWRLEKVVRSPRFRGWELGWEMGRQLLWGCLLRIYSDLESLSSPSPNSEFCPAACEAQKTSQVRAKLQPKPFGMGRHGPAWAGQGCLPNSPVILLEYLAEYLPKKQGNNHAVSQPPPPRPLPCSKREWKWTPYLSIFSASYKAWLLSLLPSQRHR